MSPRRPSRWTRRAGLVPDIAAAAALPAALASVGAAPVQQQPVRSRIAEAIVPPASVAAPQPSTVSGAVAPPIERDSPPAASVAHFDNFFCTADDIGLRSTSSRTLDRILIGSSAGQPAVGGPEPTLAP